MTDEQRSLVGYKSKVVQPGEFQNPNEGKTPLNDNDEYVLKLVKFPHVILQKQPKQRKDGTQYFEDVEKAVCEFEEPHTKNIVTAFFRVDKLNFSDDDSFRSAVIRFFQKIGHPLSEHIEPNWEEYFVVGMRFRARVVVGTEKKSDGTKVSNGRYYLDVPTCRKLLPGDTAGETFAPATPETKPDSSLANALLLAKGAKDRTQALDALANAKAPKELTLAFFNADLTGTIIYPI